MRCLFGVVFPRQVPDPELGPEYEVMEIDDDYSFVYAMRLESYVFENDQIEPRHMVTLEALNTDRITTLTNFYETLADPEDKKITCGWTMV